MDGPQDLGGKDGYGPVDPTTPAFAHDWEARQWALSKNVPIPGGTIDFWRHGIENMAPAVYMTIPYFEKWALNEMAHRVDQGVFTVDELVNAGDIPAPSIDAKDIGALLEQLRANNTDFARDISVPPRFAVGAAVMSRRTPTPGHTRLPAYARGARGHVIAHHGGHLLPDAGAKGQHVPEHLYTVEFSAAELWGDGAPSGDTVCLDLWESYLEDPR